MKRIGFAVLCFVLLLGISGTAGAQEIWTYTPVSNAGCVTSVGSGNGQTWATACDGDANGNVSVRHLNPDGTWSTDTFRAFEVTVSNQGVAWAIKVDGSIWQHFPAPFNWVRLSGCAQALGAGDTLNDLWRVDCVQTPLTDAPVYRHRDSGWYQPQTSIRTAQVNVAYDNAAWMVDMSGAIWRWNGTRVVRISGCAQVNFPYNSNGAGVVVGCDGTSIWDYRGGFVNMWNDGNGIWAVSNHGDYYISNQLKLFVRAITNVK